MADHEQGARLRAAFAYAGLSKDERAELLGVSKRTVSRMEAGTSPLGPEQRERVINETGVPAWFFETGFEVPPEPVEPSVVERVEALERKVESLIRRPGADEPPAPPGELLQLPGDPKPNDGTGQHGETGQDKGAARGNDG